MNIPFGQPRIAYLIILLALLCIANFACGSSTKTHQVTANLDQVSVTPKIRKKHIPVADSWERLANLDQYAAVCENNTLVELGGLVGPIASAHVGVPYNQAKGNDCSGMFHQVLSEVQTRCPNHTLPSLSEARSTRDLAKWYHEIGELVIVNNEEDMAELIKPGAVLFFGHSGKRYKRIKARELYGSKSRKGIVEHMGIVTGVERGIVNGKDVVTNYHLFHGRYTGRPSAITKWHPMKETKEHPAYGNGDQQWVAVARILSPGSE